MDCGVAGDCSVAGDYGVASDYGVAGNCSVAGDHGVADVCNHLHTVLVQKYICHLQHVHTQWIGNPLPLLSVLKISEY